MFAVDVVNLDKRFHHRRHGRRGERLALTDVSFTIARGECVAILGQNGSGKSTLVRILSTLLLPDGGSARVFGHDVVRDAKAVRSLVNRVSVEASFFKRMSASENLAYAARFYGFTPATTRERIPEILEPTTGLDPRSKREVQEFIREVRATHDTTILLCTHDLAEAETLAERVGILHAGRLLALEPTGNLIDRYDASTLEDAFFTATGIAFDEDEEEEASPKTAAASEDEDEEVIA